MNVVFVALMAPFVILAAQEQRLIHATYGKSKCSYCRMIFSEKNFGGELQTASDSVFIFDATECMVAFLTDKLRERAVKSIWSVDFQRPSTLIDARAAAYIRSNSLLSPMGVNVAAFASREEADTANVKLQGDTLDWAGVVKLVRQKWFPRPPRSH